MPLSNDLISQFVKATKDTNTTEIEKTVYGTVKVVKNADGSDSTYVVLDGSDIQTPVTSTVDVKHGERVTVLIKNHTATITGNISSPSARTDDVKENTTKISEFDILVAHKVSTDDLTAINATIESLRAKTARFDNMEAVNAELDNLQAKYADIERLTVTDIDILNAEIESLRATIGEFTDIETEQLDAMYADIDQLKAYNAEFTYLSAVKADVEELEAKKLDATWANIDFANIDKATLNEIYAQSGLIENVTMEDGTVTGYLVGVTIKGDLIEGNTIVAEKLVIKGEDGLYYKLNTDGVTTEAEQTEHNSLNGQVITAKSITATKISVSDLVAFDATIGGFNITEGAIYSGVKESIDNTTSGLYLGKDGQISLGDETNFLKYYKDEEGNFKLEISAESILFGANSKSSAADLKALTEHVKIGTIVDEETGDEKPCVTLAEGDSDFKQVITNTKTIFLDGSIAKTEISTDGLKTNNITIDGALNQSGFVWAGRSNGNYGLSWKGATS